MSDIPFVNALGDAMESAIATRSSRRRRFLRGPRRAGLAVAALAVVATGVAVAQIGSDPQELAVNQIACYEAASLDGNVTVVAADGRPPVAVCAKVLRTEGQPVPALVACARGAGVAVLRGRDCRRLGLEPLPAGYDLAREQVAELDRAVAAVENGQDCIPAHDLAARAQGLLDRLGWQGWRAVVVPSDRAPCGWIRRPDGAGLSLTAALRVDRSRLMVTTGPPRSVRELLFGPASAAALLTEDSGERCFTVADLRDHARARLADADAEIRFTIGQLPSGVGVEPPRGDRYGEGCAIATGAYPVYPDPSTTAIEVEILQEGR